MSNPSTSKNQDVDQIFKFWFDPSRSVQWWFRPSAEVDDEIQQRFGHLIEQAQSTPWTPQPVGDETHVDQWPARHGAVGALALILLLDQFPRNIYRGSPKAFAGDKKARDIAIQAIARKWDTQVPLIQQPFYYLPLMHDESLLGQIAGRSLYQELTRRCQGQDHGADSDALEEKTKATEFAGACEQYLEKHLNVILKFGRFPSRNQALSRESCPSEIAFLKDHPNGF